MSGVSVIHSGSDYYSQMVSGKRIQSAADSPAEMAIIQKETAQINGYNMGVQNAEDGKSVLDVSDGALSGIADSLQRMRELAVQASNSAILSDGDRKAIQYEVEQLKQGISDIANNTEFNTKKLLDGSNTNMHIASGANGEGHDLNTGDATLKALGIEDFDVTGSFDIQTIDRALHQVSSLRSSIGAQSNSLDYTIGYNTHTAYNLTNAVSRMEDTDYAKAATERDKERLMQNVNFIMQKKKMEEDQKKLSRFYM